MRSTLTLDEDLLADAREPTGLTETSALIRAALVALIQRESARRLARLGGSQPRLNAVRRRRSLAPIVGGSSSATKAPES